MVEGRALDDDGNVLLRFNNGANGVLTATRVAAGEENPLKIRVWRKRRIGMGTAGTQYIVCKVAGPAYAGISYAGVGYKDPLSSFASHNTRTPVGIGGLPGSIWQPVPQFLH